MTAIVQISQTHAEIDEVCITIVVEPGVHIRVAVSDSAFTDLLLSGRKTNARIVRWRHDKNAEIKPSK